MPNTPYGFAFFIMLGAGACLDSGPTAVTAELQATLAVRYCDEEFDCSTACDCINGTCFPDGAGPPPPVGACAIPPSRACGAASDCRSGCACTGGTCVGNGPAPDYCALPPPDQYEPNDTITTATSYLGTPQTHAFWDRYQDPEDWIWVYFAAAGTYTFDTSDSYDTYMELYRFTGSSWPPTASSFSFVAANDNKCGLLGSFCWGSRITTTAAAGSLYAARVINQAVGAMNAYDQALLPYTFSVW